MFIDGKVTKTSPFRSMIARRTALVVLAVSLLASVLSLSVMGPLAYERGREDVEVRLQGLLDAVEGSASAACFVEDSALAREVAQGLLKNAVVSRVVIRSNTGELAHDERAPTTSSRHSGVPAPVISRKIHSPFQSTKVIGEILLTPSEEELARLAQSAFVFTAGSLLLQLAAFIGVVIYAVFRWIVLPIKGMSDSLSGMHPAHREALEIPRGHEDTELGRLAEDINGLTASLALAKVAAEDASRSKGDFLANMSHEIRTPINAVMGMAHLALKTDLDAQQRDYLEKIRRSATHLLGLVNEVLDFAKIETGQLNLDPTVFRRDEWLDSLCLMVEPRAREKGLALTYTVEAGTPEYLFGDRLRLGQIVLNYLNNAIKFTASGSVRLLVRVAERGDDDELLRFEVEDSGIGLSEAQIDRLFKSFQQADVSTSRQYGGSGLGLAICKQLAELMGGQVGVRSSPGRGSTFWATARLRRLSPQALREALAAAGGGDAAAGEERRFDGARILLAEDNELNQQIAREMLEDAGATVSVAGNGRQALEMLGRGDFDCILMDVRMPEMDGLQATRRIQEMPARRGIPVIAMTANGRLEDREECLRAGMVDFISKPVSPEQFFRTLSKWVTPSASSREAAESRPAAAPPAGSGEGAGPLDLQVTAKLARNDPLRVQRFLRVFLISGRQGMEESRRAARQGDLAALAGLGHRLKAAARSVGAMRLGLLMETLESDAAAGDPALLGATLGALEAEWAGIEMQLLSVVGEIPEEGAPAPASPPPS